MKKRVGLLIGLMAVLVAVTGAAVFEACIVTTTSQIGSTSSYNWVDSGGTQYFTALSALSATCSTGDDCSGCFLCLEYTKYIWNTGTGTFVAIPGGTGQTQTATAACGSTTDYSITTQVVVGAVPNSKMRLDLSYSPPLNGECTDLDVLWTVYSSLVYYYQNKPTGN